MKDFIKSFNTLALVLYMICMLIFVSITNNPIVQAAFFVSVCLLIVFTDRKSIKNALILAAFIGIPVMLINPIINSRGATVLFRLGEIPALGEVKITVECLGFALVLMFKLVNTVLLFVFLNLAAEPDKIFNLMAFAAPRSAVTAALTARMVPSMAESSRRIAEVQMTRGVQLDSKNILKRISAGWPFIKILAFSSLEGSWQTAEALESKGYGLSGRRCRYNESFKIRDLLIILAGITLVTLIILQPLKDFVDFRFFPRLAFINAFGIRNGIFLLILPVIVTLPAILGWGYKNCKFIKQRS